MADTIALMRKRVLDMAVRGELVEQREQEGTAEELFHNIQLTKKQLIKEGILKKEKSLSEIEMEAIPFSIPKTWKWVKLHELSSLITDGTHKTPTYMDNGVPFLSIKNISQGKLDMSDIKYISQEEHEELIKRCYPEKGDILFCRIGTLGRAHLIESDFDFSIFVSVGLIKLPNKNIGKYLKYMMGSPEFYRQIDEVKVVGSHASKLNLRDVRNMLIPLPPIAEQKRIVAKIEEIFAIIDQTGKRKEESLTIIQNMRQAALRDAIMGVLVEQDETDEPASTLYDRIKNEKESLVKAGKIKNEKPLPEIDLEEVPFEIPECWKWVMLGNLTNKMGSGSTPRGGQSNYTSSGIPFIRSQNVYHDGLRLNNVVYISEETNESKKGSQVFANDILLNITGASIGRCSIVPSDFEIGNVNQHVLIVRLTDKSIKRYVHYVLTSPYIFGEIMSLQSGGTKEGLSATNAKLMKIPIPPLSEQERIVTKLDEIMAICDQMEAILDGSTDMVAELY